MIIWLQKLLQDVDVDCSLPTPLHCDNQNAIKIVTNPIFHECIKHIEIDCYFIQSCMKYIPYYKACACVLREPIVPILRVDPGLSINENPKRLLVWWLIKTRCLHIGCHHDIHFRDEYNTQLIEFGVIWYNLDNQLSELVIVDR